MCRDEDVEPAEQLRGSLERDGQRVTVGEVGPDRVPAELARGVLDALGAADERDGRSGSDERLGHATPQAAAATGDQRTPAGQVEQPVPHGPTVLDRWSMVAGMAPFVIGSTPLIAIVRFHAGGDLAGTVEALARGGVEAIELTIDTPGALAAVSEAAAAGRTVGVGTVLTADQVRASADAGARFVVSPALVPEVIEVALELGVEPLPGVFTATELVQALGVGTRAVKLFPASAGGPGYLRALRGPFPSVPIVPTGGVRMDEIGDYLAAGAAAVALGSELVGRSAPASDDDLAGIESRAALAVAAASA